MTAQPEWMRAEAAAYGMNSGNTILQIWPGSPGEIPMARETRSVRLGSAGTGGLGPGVRRTQKGVFRKEGEYWYWTLGYGGKAFRLKDTKGFGYLAHLLRHPGVEFHVLGLER
jgi:hypothetical protein